MSVAPVLSLYDPNAETIVSADASNFGLGTVLLQKQEDEETKPIAYVSRSLSEVEQRYTQIEKEALAFTWACERLSDYLIGIKFHIQTDHKPLVPLFSCKSFDNLPVRVQHFRLRMMRFDYTISHVPGSSWLLQMRCLELLQESQLRVIYCFVDMIVNSLPASEKRVEEIKLAQEQDEACREMKQYCLQGWPNKGGVSLVVRPYYAVAAEISISEGLLLRGSRIIIPSSLRKKILQRLHTGHQGISKCRDRAKQSVWWPGLSSQLQDVVSSCEVCRQHYSQRAEPLIRSELPQLPWQKVGMDLFDFQGSTYLIIIDYYSRYIEIAKLNRTTAGEVVTHCKSIFARHGIPEVVNLLQKLLKNLLK